MGPDPMRTSTGRIPWPTEIDAFDIDQSVVCATASITEKSMIWPYPERLRSRSVARVANAATMPATSYAIGAGGISGGFDGMPAFQTMPLIASITASFATQSRYGP